MTRRTGEPAGLFLRIASNAVFFLVKTIRADRETAGFAKPESERDSSSERSVIDPDLQERLESGTEDQWDCLRRLVAELDPKRIAVNCSEDSPFAGDLTVGQQRQLLQALGPIYGARSVASDQLAINWLQVRSRSELETYPQIIAVAKAIVAEVFSSRVVRP